MNLSIKKDIVKLIKEFEGFKAEAYICPSGFRTIGYGHVLAANDKINSIDEDKAELLLYQDIAKAQASVIRNINVEITTGQFDALTSFTFNLGAAALQRSALRLKVNRGEHEQVPKEFMRWVYACGRILPGLVRRRKEESYLYSS
jgi:lysozyme